MISKAAIADRNGTAASRLQFLAPLRVVLCVLQLHLSIMAASRLLGAAAACVMLLCFAAGHRKSHLSGCQDPVLELQFLCKTLSV